MKDFDDDSNDHYKKFYEDYEKSNNIQKKEIIDTFNNNKKHFSCKTPNRSIPSFEIENNILKISFQCGYYKNREFEFRDAIKTFVHTIYCYINLEDYYYWQKKDHNKKFKFFCLDCHQHLCKICLERTSIHSKHKLVIFSLAKIESKKLAKNLNKTINELNNFDKDLKELFNIIYDLILYMIFLITTLLIILMFVFLMNSTDS